MADTLEDEEQGLSRLHIAAARGDTETVRNLLMSSATGDVGLLGTKPSTPSHKVTIYRRVDPVDFPLSKGDGVNARNAFGETSLHLAAENGHLATVQLLLSSMADVNAICRSQATPLHLAAKSGHADIVENLIRYGANVHACNNEKMTALHLACRDGHTSIAEILLDNHATVDVMTQSEETPFYLAAKIGHADVTDLLLSRGVCDFVLTRRDKETPLHIAVKRGYTEVVEVILKHSSRISGKLINCGHKLQETSGIIPIQLLRYGYGDRYFSAGLVWSEKNKPLEMWEDEYGHTALDIAAKSVQPKMVKLLLNADKGTYSEKHLRQLFCNLGRSKINDMVTECRNNSETITDQSDTEKYEMFYENRNEIAQGLISSSKFNANYQSATGYTPIHAVITEIGRFHDVPDESIHMLYFIQSLLENGADFNTKNSNLETPLMIASKIGSCDAIQILFNWEKQSGMKLDLDARDRYGETALMKAVATDEWCYNMEILMHKSERELDIDARDRYGANSFIKAAERSRVSVIRLLLDHKASVNVCDFYGFTALHAAVYNRMTSCFDLQFFWKDLRKQNFDGASNSLETSSMEQLQLRRDIEDSHGIIDWLQSHIGLIEGAIPSRNVLNHMQRKTGDPHVVFGRLLSNLRFRLEAVKLLLDNDETNVNAKDFRGYTPLDLAMESVMEINSTTLKAPTNYGAIRKFQETPIQEVTGVDDRGRNPLHRLMISRICVCLFSHLTSVNKIRQDQEHFDFMIKGILLNPENFRELATATDIKGRTPLHYAAMAWTTMSCNDAKKANVIIKMLLGIGSKVNTADIYGKTHLHYVEKKEPYELLVQHGAEENAKDNFGNTPRDLKVLRDLVTINKDNAERRPNEHLYSPVDIAQVLSANHVTELTKRKQVETIRIYSRSPRHRKLTVKAVWRMWSENKFIRLNRRLTQLKAPVKHFIDRLANSIKAKDWRFECQPISVGSAEEETKVTMSADFDFNFRLIKFSELCDPFPYPLGPKGYFQLRRKTNEDTKGLSDDQFACFFNLDHYLLTDAVNSTFKILLDEVLSDLWQCEHQFDWIMEHKYFSIYGAGFDHSGMCTAIRLRMLNPIEDGEGGFLFVDISIDIVACVHVDDWWPDDALPVGINPALKTDGCTFVFHRPDIWRCSLRGTRFIFSDTFARISFAPLESRVIKNCSPLFRAAYMVCKIILYSERGTTYQLKTCLLFCMEALNARNGNETTVEDKVTRKQLAFWVERIMFCFMEFSRHHFFPLYFMPSFRQEVKYIRDGKIYLESKIDEQITMVLTPFSYRGSYDLYLDLCPADTAIDIPVKDGDGGKNRNHDPNNDPLWERFEREDFIRLLSSRRFH